MNKKRIAVIILYVLVTTYFTVGAVYYYSRHSRDMGKEITRMDTAFIFSTYVLYCFFPFKKTIMDIVIYLLSPILVCSLVGALYTGIALGTGLFYPALQAIIFISVFNLIGGLYSLKFFGFSTINAK